MTPATYRKSVNVMAVITSAAFAGGGLLILVSYGIRWLGTDPLVMSARLDWRNRPVRRVWMWAIWLYVANTVFTLGYFIPQNVLLIWDSYTAAEASDVRATWLGLHVIRVAIALAVPVFALLAVLKHSEEPAT